MKEGMDTGNKNSSGEKEQSNSEEKLMSSGERLREEDEDDEQSSEDNDEFDSQADKNDSMIPSEEEVYEISNIHTSPQKQPNDMSQVHHKKVVSASRSPKISDLTYGVGEFMNKYPSEDKRVGKKQIVE